MNPFEMFKNLGAVQEQLKQAQEKRHKMKKKTKMLKTY